MLFTTIVLILSRDVSSYALAVGSPQNVDNHMQYRNEDTLASTLDVMVTALVGKEAIEDTNTFAYHPETLETTASLFKLLLTLFIIFRGHTLSQNLKLFTMDQSMTDTGAARRFFLNAVEAGVPLAALVVCTRGPRRGGHSTFESLVRLAETGGFGCLPLTAENWRARNA